jgi:hypothetical protein
MENFDENKDAKQRLIVKELKEKILSAISGEHIQEKYSQTVDFAYYLLDKYPEARTYQLFHVLTGSTTPIILQNFDFPGEDSVEKFINERL